jgi:hypothetical protein
LRGNSFGVAPSNRPPSALILVRFEAQLLKVFYEVFTDLIEIHLGNSELRERQVNRRID